MSSVFKILLPFLLLCAAVARAQSVRWEPGSGTLAQNQLSDLGLVFDQCEPEGDVTLPAVAGLAFGSPNRSTNTSFTVVNFKASTVKTVTLSYRVRPSERRTIVIPSFSVLTDKGRLTVPAATFEVGDATVGQTGLSLESIARSYFTAPARELWAGEVFPLTYTLSASKRYLYNLNKDFDWAPSPLVPEPWSQPDQIEASLNNDLRISIVYKTRALVKNPGTVSIPAATHLVNVSVGSSGFGPFSRANLDQFVITTAPASVLVRALPVPAPAGFAGAVGKFTLDSKIAPAKAAVGEPITWTLVLDGTGNWPDIPGLPARSVSKDFRIVQPQAKRAAKNDSLYDASISEDIVLIPSRAGSYTLGPVSFPFFNPETGAYETLTTKPVVINVAPAAPAPGQTSVTGHAAANASVDESAPPSSGGTLPAAPVPPSALPRDPVPAASGSFRPWTAAGVFWASLVSVLLPLAGWIVLAYRRARATDPELPRRAACSRMVATLAEIDAVLRQTPSDDPVPGVLVSRLLPAWRRDAAILFRLTSAAPQARDFADDAWASLWIEADRTGYRARHPLPADWTARARAALAGQRAPFNPWLLFRPGNLLPVVIAVVALGSAGSLRAEEPAPSPLAAYGRADWTAAEQAWRKALAADSADWTAHHNLSLTLSQQNRTGEAAAHALAAFVQRPQSLPVRAQLAYAWQAAGVAPADIKPFLLDTPAGSLARLASPARWQLAVIASAWALAASALFALAAAYRRPSVPRMATRLAPVCALVALSALAASLLALRTYGPLADRHVAIVASAGKLCSIPTDLDHPQKTAPLSLGTVAVSEKTFLGWTRVQIPDGGAVGWVRTETLVPLW